MSAAARGSRASTRPARAIGDALLALGRGRADGRRTRPDLLDAIEGRMAGGLVALCETT